MKWQRPRQWEQLVMETDNGAYDLSTCETQNVEQATPNKMRYLLIYTNVKERKQWMLFRGAIFQAGPKNQG
jgi:hypothetical protein